MKAERARGADAPTAHALTGRSRRDAVRKAVAADADDLRNRRSRARRPGRRAAGRRRARDGASRSPTSPEISSAGSTPSSSGRSRSVLLEEFAAAATRLHVINALTDEEHPCQALADFLTLQERLGPLAGRTLAFVGDGNNVAASLAHAAAMLGVQLPRRESSGLSAAGHRSCSRPPNWRATARGCGCSAIRPTPSPAPTPSTPTRGRRWDRKPKRKCAESVRAVPGERRA